MTAETDCRCGDPDPTGCLHSICGYPWCNPCGEHHRPPECAINEAGESLASCGHPWVNGDGSDHDFACLDDDVTHITPEIWEATAPAAHISVRQVAVTTPLRWDHRS